MHPIVADGVLGLIVAAVLIAFAAVVAENRFGMHTAALVKERRRNG